MSYICRHRSGFETRRQAADQADASPSTGDTLGDGQVSCVRVGLAAFCADWFRQVGLQTGGCGLADTLHEDYSRMAAFLRQCFDQVVAPGVISTATEAAEAANSFREAGIDALLAAHIMWSEDQPLLELLRSCQDIPLVLWNYHPTGVLPAKLTVNDLFRLSGTVGMLQGSAPMERLRTAVHMVSGTPGDPGLAQVLREYNAAVGIRKMFRGMRAARIAGRCEAMTGTWVDGESLRSRLGVELLEISAAEYASFCEAVEANRIEAFRERLTRDFPLVDVSTASLRLACRNTLALDDLAMKHNLGAAAIQDLDPELHRLAGIRPCLCPPASGAELPLAWKAISLPRWACRRPCGPAQCPACLRKFLRMIRGKTSC